jgi:hypothetical protein
MPTLTMQIGFDQGKPEDDAAVEALAEFAEAAERHGRTVLTATAAVVRSAERAALGEYAVVVTGEWSDGDQ